MGNIFWYLPAVWIRGINPGNGTIKPMRQKRGIRLKEEVRDGCLSDLNACQSFYHFPFTLIFVHVCKAGLFVSSVTICLYLVVSRPTTKLVRDNTKAYLRLSELHYHMGEVEDALRCGSGFKCLY